ncbi:hypothetical protein LLH00_03090 [bacterium]|nr:hypothetical protein [bacterium]
MKLGATYGLTVLLAVLGVQIAPLSAAGGGSDLEALRRGYSAAADSLAAQRARRDSLSARLERVSAEVARLKQGVAQDMFSPVEQYRLGESLRAGKSLADSLDRLNVRLSALERRTGTAREALRRGLGERIESLGRQPDSRGQIVILRRERESLAAGTGAVRADNPLPDLSAALRVEPDDSPDQVRDKADFAADLAARVRRGLDILRTEMERVKDENAVRRRTGEFAQEMALFDEGLTLRRTDARGGVAAADVPPDDGKTVDANAVGPDRGESGYGDGDFGMRGEISTSPGSITSETAGASVLDRELFDPDREHLLNLDLESLSPDQIEAVLTRLSTRRDSLERELGRLQQLEKSLRSQAGKLGADREGAGRK